MGEHTQKTIGSEMVKATNTMNSRNTPTRRLTRACDDATNDAIDAEMSE